MNRKVAILIFLIAISAGCSTSGSYLAEEDVAEVQESITTAQQLQVELGTPSVTIPRDDGTIMWVFEEIYRPADPTNYIPYLGMLIGTNSKYCTRLTVLVDRETGSLSDWNYEIEEDTDYWAKTDDKCMKAKRK